MQKKTSHTLRATRYLQSERALFSLLIRFIIQRLTYFEREIYTNSMARSNICMPFSYKTKALFGTKKKVFYYNASRSESHVDSGKMSFLMGGTTKRHKDAHKNKTQDLEGLNAAWCEILSSLFKTKSYILRYTFLVELQTNVATDMIKMHVEEKEISLR